MRPGHMYNVLHTYIPQMFWNERMIRKQHSSPQSYPPPTTRATQFFGRLDARVHFFIAYEDTRGCHLFRSSTLTFYINIFTPFFKNIHVHFQDYFMKIGIQIALSERISSHYRIEELYQQLEQSYRSDRQLRKQPFKREGRNRGTSARLLDSVCGRNIVSMYLETNDY